MDCAICFFAHYPDAVSIKKKENRRGIGFRSIRNKRS